MAVSEAKQRALVDYHYLFDSLPALYLVLTPQFEVAAATDAYLKTTFTKREDIIGCSLFEVLPDNPNNPEATTVENLRASLQTVCRDKVADTMATQQYDVLREDAPGEQFETRYWSPVNAPVFDSSGRLIHIIHRIEDVTEFMTNDKDVRHRDEHQKKATIDESIEALIHRSFELQESNQRLNDKNSAKSDFLSRMSHELRTPLNSILGFAQVLDRQELDDDRRDSVQHILKAGRHLLALINDVLDISRIEARRLELSVEPVTISPIVHETIALMIPMATEKKVEIVAARDRSEFVHADRQRLRQVLINLLSNAIKYNRPGGAIQIHYSVTGDDRLRVLVRDTGIGIASKYLEDVFSPFGRFTDLQIEGAGIGLSLSKSLVEAMGGSIGFTSVEHEGSEFWIELDIVDRKDAVELAEPSDNNHHGVELDARVLCIEDNAANLTLIERILQRFDGLELVTAVEGRRGIEMAHELRPDVVLLDIHLPDMNGSDVIVELQADPDTAHLPIVVLSADATERQMRRMLELGAVAYLTKPIMLDEFDQVMTSLLAPSP